MKSFADRIMFRKTWIRSELPGIIAILLGSLAYFLVAPSHILGGDNGEFVALTHSPGIAHPPGYPLYVLYLRLMSWLPGEAARPSSLATALLGGMQLGILYAAARAWRAPALPAGIALAVYAASPLALHLNSHAEVFALNGLLASSLLFLAGEDCPLSPKHRLLLNSLLLGLGLSHHHSIVLLSPLILCTAVSSARSLYMCDNRNWRKYVILSFAALVVGLLPYFLLFPWSNESGQILSSWGGINSFVDLGRHFLRSDYGTLRLTPGIDGFDVIGQQRFLIDSLWWTWSLLLPIAMIGLIEPFFRLRHRSRRWWCWLALLASLVASGPLFVSLFNIPLGIAPGHAVLERFHMMPALLLVIPVAHGLTVSSGYVRSWLFRRRPSPPGSSSAVIDIIAVCILVVFSFVFSARLASARFQERHSSEVHRFLLNGILEVPEGSLVIVRGDHKVFGYAALQAAEKRRPDITFLAQPHWSRLWYRRRFLPESDGHYAELAKVVSLHIKKGGHVFVDQATYRAMTPYERRLLPTYQQGLLRRVLSPGERRPSPASLLRDNELLFASFDLPQLRLTRGDGWSFYVRDAYAQAWEQLAVDLGASGRIDLARIASRHADRYAP